jgi:hypothetical protein
MALFTRLCALFSPSGVAALNSAELEERRNEARRMLWEWEEEVVVLEGTAEEKAELEERKGAGAVESRRAFLEKAGVRDSKTLRKKWGKHYQVKMVE